MNLPYDTSGSRSKNRFRLELLWGVCKMFDMYISSEEDFNVVFDYVCDIEIHTSNHLELFQVKTKKVQSPYNINKLLKLDDTGKSILGKLFLVKASVPDTASIDISVVSNAFLKVDRTIFSQSEIICLDDLAQADKQSISNKLCKELNCPNINLRETYFIYTSMDLIKPEDAVKGKLLDAFESKMNCEPNKPNALYRLIKSSVSDKACYEFEVSNYNDLLRAKGMNRNELSALFEKHTEKTDICVEKTIEYIEGKYSSPIQRKKYKNALNSIYSALLVAKQLKEIELSMAKYLNTLDFDSQLTYDSILDLLIAEYTNTFPKEYSEAEIMVFSILILQKWEANRYE